MVEKIGVVVEPTVTISKTHLILLEGRIEYWLEWSIIHDGSIVP